MQCHPAALTVVRKLHLGTSIRTLTRELHLVCESLFNSTSNRATSSHGVFASIESIVDILYHGPAICSSSFYVDLSCSACIGRVSQSCGNAGRKIVLAAFGGW